ncbi:DUF6283 family protein [Deinococcus sp. Leaf326]|uniref:DUF6283 family protein n=1 Tax=Deinococcus sp. Leaf326 TaxID=1736338 RepID=UPI0006FDDFAA|nr:DUF6283 family protein [Deinococcus sp. Leaf326]KQR22894.1 hypothetical protein ASF71_06925 [Deinococcus sp. Leaf326]
MKYDLTQPCPDCPFRTDCREGWLGGDRAAEIAQAITQHQQTFTCHKTLPESANSQHCAGAMILLERLNRPNQMMRIMERFGGYDRARLRMDAPVFKSVAAFIRHHN